jgi:hypothetical protein
MRATLLLCLFLTALSICINQSAWALFRHQRAHCISRNAFQSSNETKAYYTSYSADATTHWSGGPIYSWQSHHRKPFPTHGILSIISSVVPILAYTAFSLTFFPFFLVPGFLFAITSIVLGAAGLKRPRNGYAIAGLSIGSLELVAGFIYLILFLALLV